MAHQKNKWIDAVGKLIELTQNRRLNWRAVPLGTDLENQNRHVDVVYETDYRGKTLRLFERRSVEKSYSEWFAAEGPQWRTETILELIDPSGLGGWAFPESEAVHHLFIAVKYQVTGVSQFLDELLAEAV
ncbi:MAG TPA: hypothetical protein VMM84_09625 [Pyrinomonadaceae bacterium]|nr:hypothetical protein [Pyrinomonadaceae bacterium]